MSVFATLKTAEIFVDFTDAQLIQVAALTEERTYEAGQHIILEQTPGDGLYLISSGMVRVLVDPSLVMDRKIGEPYVIATLRHGQSFGEISLVDEGMRSASVQAAQYDTRIVFIPRDRLIALCEAQPELGYRLMRNLAADIAMKIRNTDLKVRDQLYYMQAGQADAESEKDAAPTP
jgi:CRP/FNR family transcriptional regulator, cyclic AMP receptor protein